MAKSTHLGRPHLYEAPALLLLGLRAIGSLLPIQQYVAGSVIVIQSATVMYLHNQDPSQDVFPTAVVLLIEALRLLQSQQPLNLQVQR